MVNLSPASKGELRSGNNLTATDAKTKTDALGFPDWRMVHRNRVLMIIWSDWSWNNNVFFFQSLSVFPAKGKCACCSHRWKGGKCWKKNCHGSCHCLTKEQWPGQVTFYSGLQGLLFTQCTDNLSVVFLLQFRWAMNEYPASSQLLVMGTIRMGFKNDHIHIFLC